MKTLELNNKGTIIGWYCKFCNLYNDILTAHCKDCQANRPSDLRQAAIDTIVSRDLVGALMPEPNESEDKFKTHALFFNEEVIFVQDMSDEQLDERLKTLAAIAFEAKTKYGAADSVKRERSAKKTVKQREWLLSPDHNDPTVTDAIATVEARKKRMSKADKMLDVMKNLGVEGAEGLVREMMRGSTEKAVNSFTFNGKTKTSNNSTEEKKESKPFDPTSLFGNK